MRSATTVWRWIVSRFSWRARMKPPSRKLGVGLGDAADHLADDVLDEAGVAVRLLDDRRLVGALHQLVDLGATSTARRCGGGRARRCRRPSLGAAQVELADAALVVGGDGDGVEDALDLVGGEAVGLQALARSSARLLLGAGAGGHALRLDAGERAGAALGGDGDAVELVDLLARRARTRARGRSRGSGPRSAPRRAGRPGARARCSAMWAASASARSVSDRTTSSIASLTTSSKRDMWTPACCGLRSTKHSSSAKKRRAAVGDVDDLLDAADADAGEADLGRGTRGLDVAGARRGELGAFGYWLHSSGGYRWGVT